MRGCFLCIVAVVNGFDQDCEGVGGEVALVLLGCIGHADEETLQYPDEVKVSLLVLRLLDGNQSLDAGSLVFNDTVDQGECVLGQRRIGVDLVNN